MGLAMTTEHSGSGDIDRSLALLWDLDGRPNRGRRPKLTLDRVVATAIEIADAEGLEAVSMRRIAAMLDVGAMSLYRYVPGKAELLDLMLDRVIEPDPDPPAPDAGWRVALQRMGEAMWELYTVHPWLPQVDQARPVLGPNALGGLDAVLGQLADLELSDMEKMQAISAIESYAAATARTHNSAVSAESRTGVSAEEFWEAQAPVLEKAMGGDRYPRMAALSDDAFAFSGEELYRFGLARMLDGLELMVEQRSQA